MNDDSNINLKDLFAKDDLEVYKKQIEEAI
jgi:hypothetical protein